MTNIEVDSEKIKELYLRIDDLKEENKRTKATLKAYAKQVERLEEENKKLKDELEETENDLEHRDSFFSIMRDVLANEEIDNTQLAAILYTVVHEECGDYDLSKKELDVVKKFRNREYI